MENNKEKMGKLLLNLSIVLYVLFLALLIILGLSGNALSHYVMDLLGDDELYLNLLGIILIAVFVIGFFLSKKAREILNGIMGSKIMSRIYWITLFGILAIIIFFIVFIIMMIVTGSFM